MVSSLLENVYHDSSPNYLRMCGWEPLLLHNGECTLRKDENIELVLTFDFVVNLRQKVLNFGRGMRLEVMMIRKRWCNR